MITYSEVLRKIAAGSRQAGHVRYTDPYTGGANEAYQIEQMKNQMRLQNAAQQQMQQGQQPASGQPPVQQGSQYPSAQQIPAHPVQAVQAPPPRNWRGRPLKGRNLQRWQQTQDWRTNAKAFAQAQGWARR